MNGFEVSRNNVLRRKIKSLLKQARRNFWDIDVKYWQFVYDSSGSMGNQNWRFAIPTHYSHTF